MGEYRNPRLIPASRHDLSLVSDDKRQGGGFEYESRRCFDDVLALGPTPGREVLQHTGKVLHTFQMLGCAWQQILWILVGHVSQAELNPEAVGELIPKSTGHYLSLR